MPKFNFFRYRKTRTRLVDLRAMDLRCELTHDSSYDSNPSTCSSLAETSSSCSSPSRSQVASLTHWTAAEDQRLDEGFMKYGRAWSMIAKVYFSSSATQHRRSAAMVRNRYLRRYAPNQAVSRAQSNTLHKSPHVCSRCGLLRKGHTCRSITTPLDTDRIGTFKLQKSDQN